MRKRVRSLGAAEDKEVSYSSYINGDEDDDPRRRRMAELIEIAIKNELTQRQRECIHMKFRKRMRVEDIAQVMGLSRSTVYKHIRLGLAAIKRCSVYF